MEAARSQSCAVNAVIATRAVIAVSSTKRIERPLAAFPRATFFSEHDVWLFVEVMDERTCPLCRRYAEHGDFHGNHLRLNFPRLKIEDVNTISANVHPNCRCYLNRLLEEELNHE